VGQEAKQAGKGVANTANRTDPEVKHAAKSGVAAAKQRGQTVKQLAAKQSAPNDTSDSK
jgi:hypothetical protein